MRAESDDSVLDSSWSGADSSESIGADRLFPLVNGLIGGAEGIRTPDPHVANVVLSQLSYCPEPKRRRILSSPRRGGKICGWRLGAEEDRVRRQLNAMGIREQGNRLKIALRIVLARIRIRRWQRSATGPLAPVLAALADTLRFRMSAQERTWIRRIEALRRQLRASDRIIERRFLGLPTERPSDGAEMLREGVMVSEPIATTCERASRQFFWGLFLFRLVRELEPRISIELGTSLGISAAYQSSALELNQQGRLMTLEGDAKLAELSAEHLAELGLKQALVVPGLFEVTLDRVLEDNNPVDFSFLDAGKKYGDMNRALEKLKPYLAPGAVVVIDDIHWSEEMRASWYSVRRDPAVRASIDLEAMGVLIIDPSAAGSTHIDLPIG